MTCFALFTTQPSVTSTFRSRRICLRPCANGPTSMVETTTSTLPSAQNQSRTERTTSSVMTKTADTTTVQTIGPLGRMPSAKLATEKSQALCGLRCRREILMPWRVAMAGHRISTSARSLRLHRRLGPMDHMDTASPIMLPLAEHPTNICDRIRLNNNTTATRRLPRTNMVPQLPGHTDSLPQALLTNTGILHSHSMAKALRHQGPGDTGVEGHLHPRVDILELDTALAGSNTRPDLMDSLRPAKADGVAIRRGIELRRHVVNANTG
jgi:hypothetical protein